MSVLGEVMKIFKKPTAPTAPVAPVARCQCSNYSICRGCRASKASCGSCRYGLPCPKHSVRKPAPPDVEVAAGKAAIVPSLWYSPDLKGYSSNQGQEVTDYYKANLIGSRRPDGKHEILLDLDAQHEYRESSTPGHGHLVLKTKDGISWDRYQVLLSLLVEFGVIEQGFFEMSLRRQQAFLRSPHVRKGYESGHKAALELLDLDRELAEL